MTPKRMRAELKTHLIRNLRGIDHFEVFMVTAVATILGMRLFLELTGFPQVGGSTLHIAHAQVGGLLMGLAIMLLLIFLNKQTETVAALIGGTGFGLFIDEVGKFVTQSNDYFFQPSVAIMYVTFVAFYLVVRYIFTSAGIHEVEYLVNAIREMQDIPGNRLREHEQQQIIYYLNRCNADHRLVQELKTLVRSIYAPPERLNLYRRWKKQFYRWYRGVAHTGWFAPAVTVFFVVQFLGSLSVMFTLMFDPREIEDTIQSFTVADWAILGSNIVAATFIALGVALLKRDRLRSYTMFQRSILVGIFVGQLFLFYKDEFGALTNLAGDLVLYLGLRFIIEREKDEVFEHEVEKIPPLAPA